MVMSTWSYVQYVLCLDLVDHMSQILWRGVFLFALLPGLIICQNNHGQSATGLHSKKTLACSPPGQKQGCNWQGYAHLPLLLMYTHRQSAKKREKESDKRAISWSYVCFPNVQHNVFLDTYVSGGGILLTDIMH